MAERDWADRIQDAYQWIRGAPGVAAVVDHDASRLLLAGVAVGVLGGAAAGIFDRAMVAVGVLLLGSGEPSVDYPVWWRAIAGPTVAGLVAGALILFGTLRKRPQSVPDVLLRTQTDEGSLTLRDGLFSAAAAAITVGGGHSGGREGPIVQVSSTLASAVCRFLRVRPREMRSLVAAGAAAGVAASFNTPVGGAFFALEIILGDFAVESFAPVVAATVTGTVVGQALLGHRIALHLPAFSLGSPLELGLYLLLGALCGVIAVMFKRLVLWFGAWADGLALLPPARAAISGLAVGLVAAAGAPEIMGNGYAWMEEAITHDTGISIAFLLVLLAVKIVATAITTGGRSGAGMFAPSLFVGAVTGLLVGKLAQAAFPSLVPSPGAYGMVGMGAVAAGVLHAPITLTLMLFEMTGNYRVILPLLVSLASAGLVARMVGVESLYEAELRHRGITLRRRPPKMQLEEIRVKDLMRTDILVRARSDEPLQDASRRLVDAPVDEAFVEDDQGHFAGTIELHTAAATLLARPGTAGPPCVADATTDDVPAVRDEASLADVIPLFFRGRADALPVVDAERHLVGLLLERDVIAACHRMIVAKDTLLGRFESGPVGSRNTDFVELPDGYALEVLEVDQAMAGRTLWDLELPRRGCLVVAHSVWDGRHGRWERHPARARQKLERGDRLVVLGPTEELGRLAGEVAG
ncbi:MAG: chloride channel protein [Myxococcota bacterium]